MFWRRNIPLFGLIGAVVVVLSIGTIGYRTIRSQSETAGWVEHTYRVIQELDRIMIAINLAESAVRGYALSYDQDLQRELAPAITLAERAFVSARELTRDNPQQSAQLRLLEPKLRRRIVLLREYMTRVQGGGSSQVLPEALEVSAAIKHITTEMIQNEQSLLGVRVAERADQTTQVLRVSGVGLGASLVVVTGAFVLIGVESRTRRHAQRRLRAKHAETTLLLQLGELLQASRNLEEACDVIIQFAPQYFERRTGSMSLFSPTHNLLETRASWSVEGAPHGKSVFAPDDCWALRLGRTHWFDTTTARTTCKHLPSPVPRSSLCLPLLAQGEVLGILHVHGEGNRLDEDYRKRAAILSEQLSMALANLALREKLRNQSIRDPLTGLFNRRYTEETLERELRRAQRESQPLSVLMMDVDHFKRFNDTFGHDAGDQVLREIGKVLSAHTRASDVVSRMGGEELLVVLPGASGPTGSLKAEELRSQISKLRIVHAGHDLGEVTISIGVAVYPQHGPSAELLLKAADAALYRAKREGRDRVIVAA